MKNIAAFVIATILLLATTLYVSAQPTTPATAKKKISGCFVQLDNSDNTKKVEDWKPQLDGMIALHFDTIIVQAAKALEVTDPVVTASSVDVDKDIEHQGFVPAVTSLLNAVAISNAANPPDKQLHVMMGLTMPSNALWGYDSTVDAAKLKTNLDSWTVLNLVYAKALLNAEVKASESNKVKDFLIGWYLPTELWNFDMINKVPGTTNTVVAPTVPALLHDFLRNNVDQLRVLKGGTPVAASVYFNPWLDMNAVGIVALGPLYHNLLDGTGLKCLIVQDCFGAKVLGQPLSPKRPTGSGFTSADQALINASLLTHYFATVCRVRHIDYWLDLEAFQAKLGKPNDPDDPVLLQQSPNPTEFVSAKPDRFEKQLALTDKNNNLQTLVIFDYPHYVAPSAELKASILKWQKQAGVGGP